MRRLPQAPLKALEPSAQRGTLGPRWFAARTEAAGQEYRCAGTQNVSPSRMTLVFLRSKSVRCPIMLTLESGGSKVEEANYQCPT